MMDIIFQYLLKGLNNNVKSRASLCMGQFAIVLTQAQLSNLTNTLINNIKSGKDRKEQTI